MDARGKAWGCVLAPSASSRAWAWTARAMARAMARARARNMVKNCQ
jgi:hypothetical protein